MKLVEEMEKLEEQLLEEYDQLSMDIVLAQDKQNKLWQEIKGLAQKIEHLEYIEKLGFLDGRTEEGTPATRKRNRKTKNGKLQTLKKK